MDLKALRLKLSGMHFFMKVITREENHREQHEGKQSSARQGKRWAARSPLPQLSSLRCGTHPFTAAPRPPPAAPPPLSQSSQKTTPASSPARPTKRAAPSLRARRAAGEAAAHQNHSLPKLGTANTPQWMKTPNLASSNQVGSGRASSEAQVGS